MSIKVEMMSDNHKLDVDTDGFLASLFFLAMTDGEVAMIDGETETAGTFTVEQVEGVAKPMRWHFRFNGKLECWFILARVNRKQRYIKRSFE